MNFVSQQVSCLRDDEVDSHNEAVIARARKAITEAIVEFVKMGHRGAVAVRVPINGGKAGNVRVTIDKDQLG